MSSEFILVCCLPTDTINKTQPSTLTKKARTSNADEPFDHQAGRKLHSHQHRLARKTKYGCLLIRVFAEGIVYFISSRVL
mmetsp:Transcript_11019/g.24254  ORF Transcript_11019/g.24254 Transcript_11019/m.24254 type:complete len:80 (-) Transcript_11019:114-353(-)